MLYSSDMKILMLSMDRNILDNQSLVQKRLITLAEKIGELMVFIPSESEKIEQISPYLIIHSVSGIIHSLGMKKPLQLGRLQTIITKTLKDKKYDLITVQDPYFLGFLGYLLSLRFNVPLEVQVHGFEKLSGLRAFLAQIALEKSEKIRVVSQRLQNKLIVDFKIPKEKMYVLPVYAQISTPTPLATREVLPLGKEGETTFTFLTVGRLVPVKNIALQIRAFARIAREFPQARLRIVGGGPEQENLQYIADALSLNDRVIFEGEQKEVGVFYQSADAFLLSSDAEGWGVAVVEAAAHGLPIVMTDVGCAGEFIQNNENGIVIPVGNETALVSAMRRIITDTELRARLGKAARASFLALPSRDEHIKKQIIEWNSVIMHR